MSRPASLAELHERYLAAWAVRDPDAIIALHAPETTFWVHHGQPAVEGSGPVRDAFATMFEALPGFGFEVHRTVFGPRHWILDWTLTCRTPAGAPAEWHCMDLVTTTADWQVVRKDTFIDGVQFERALAG
ncbi:hypothetical protein TUM20985_14070 [Mycobacterium antarcticum]|uniref:nuclear transport factor 2 family protein n=1 Tax=unclassified Mycolicibacterium TaxID=2636767 RepID=UPI0023840C74|nr:MULTISPECIES: nuclear transport factor 2 family protein [unclassified Mycolicibacterium]BDX30860.1 hypothetical protein TUM20985_14070 [Mycolicibacterium sp. TUM20985]GLP74224.1 hypothetical protein TUM20983_13340 [Mycolicibacterium sp. TUM20983]GLP80020.1 hypothetical protein TUM20984_14400 [Mycolicibacterium sp. TUM20984]